ncbi:Putative manganese-containing catalase [Candidatus Arthromitus sp. SFB-2]|nr:Putative manganese-containing catalase [Candidatus Arthromitus sp. SFB-2]
MMYTYRSRDINRKLSGEELGHLEIISQTIMLLNGHDVNAESTQSGEIQSQVLFGLNPGLVNSSGYSWTGDYVSVTGDLCADLLSNIASEQRAKVVYEYLYRQIHDKKVKQTIDFLLNREEAHNAMFRKAFNKIQESGSNKDFGTTPDAQMYLNLSSPSPSDNKFSNINIDPPSFK